MLELCYCTLCGRLFIPTPVKYKNHMNSKGHKEKEAASKIIKKKFF